MKGEGRKLPYPKQLTSDLVDYYIEGVETAAQNREVWKKSTRAADQVVTRERPSDDNDDPS